MFAGFAKEFYQKAAPTWFKAIPWHEVYPRMLENQKWNLVVIWIPLLAYYGTNPDRLPWMLVIKKPQTEEERLQLKRDHGIRSAFYRNFEIDQYNKDVQPMYDLAVRRKKYPEYYGNRYDGFERSDV